jgi:hypothetical protein
MDREFAELTARIGLEPELADLYRTDPEAVLASFGLAGAQPRRDAPVLTIERLDSPDTIPVARLTDTWRKPAKPKHKPTETPAPSGLREPC